MNTKLKPTCNIHEPTVCVNKQNTKPKKYDIITTVNNKDQIDNECVR